MWFDECWFWGKWDQAFGRAESIQKMQIFSLCISKPLSEFWGKVSESQCLISQKPELQGQTCYVVCNTLSGVNLPLLTSNHLGQAEVTSNGHCEPRSLVKAVFCYVGKDWGSVGLSREKDGPGLASVMADRCLGWIKTSVYLARSDWTQNPKPLPR